MLCAECGVHVWCGVLYACSVCGVVCSVFGSVCGWCCAKLHLLNVFIVKKQ